MIGKIGLFLRREFNPKFIAGLTGWWDASASTTLFDSDTGGSPTLPDSGVGRFEDRSGANRHLYQGENGFRPLRKTAARNSLDVLRFDGTDDSMYSYSMYSFWRLEDIIEASGYSGQPGYTVIAAAKCAAASFNDGTDPINNELLLSSDGSTFGAFYFRSSNLVGAYGFTVTSPDPPFGTPVFAETAYTVNDWAVFTQTWDGTDLTISLNGGTASTTPSPQLLSGNNSVYLGYNGYVPGTLFEGDLGELIVYNKPLTLTERQQLEDYLAQKWGI